VHHHQAHHGDREVIRRDQPCAAEQAERRHPGWATRPRRDECLERSRRGQESQFRQHPRWRISRRNERKSESTSNDRRSHFTAAAPKAAAAGENQVSVAPLAHCETRLEGTLSPRFSRAHADALVS